MLQCHALENLSLGFDSQSTDTDDHPLVPCQEFSLKTSHLGRNVALTDKESCKETPHLASCPAWSFDQERYISRVLKAEGEAFLDTKFSWHVTERRVDLQNECESAGYGKTDPTFLRKGTFGNADEFLVYGGIILMHESEHEASRHDIHVMCLRGVGI